jgi:Fe-S-cluster containining protein
MRIRLVGSDHTRSFDTQLGRFTDGETIPCFRCGECCRRWQPLIGLREAERLARALGLPVDDFLDRYTRPYPLEEGAHLLEQRDGACVFLRAEADGRTACSVHEARPEACRDWDASLFRRECLAGIRCLPGPAGILLPLPLYDEPAEAGAFLERLRSGAAGA